MFVGSAVLRPLDPADRPAPPLPPTAARLNGACLHKPSSGSADCTGQHDGIYSEPRDTDVDMTAVRIPQKQGLCLGVCDRNRKSIQKHQN